MTRSELINQTTFIYHIANDTCYIQVSNQLLRELTIKGTTEQNGLVNGTWFQVDDQINHWISFKKDKFQAHKWETFINGLAMITWLNIIAEYSWE